MSDRHARLIALAVIAIATLSTAACATVELTPEEIRSVGIADLRARAGQGDLSAQVTLGDLYAEGDGVPQDEAEAVRWYRLAAEQKGSMPADGRGVTDDPFFMPIAVGQTAIEVGIMEFATIPNSGGRAARMMLLVDEPGTGRLFVNSTLGVGGLLDVATALGMEPQGEDDID